VNGLAVQSRSGRHVIIDALGSETLAIRQVLVVNSSLETVAAQVCFSVAHLLSAEIDIPETRRDYHFRTGPNTSEGIEMMPVRCWLELEKGQR
jgi:hypothetical protein